MAIAMLQEQLLRTRDQLSALRVEQLRQQQAEQPAGEAESSQIRELEVRERALLGRIDRKTSGVGDHCEGAAEGSVGGGIGSGDCEKPPNKPTMTVVPQHRSESVY